MQGFENQVCVEGIGYSMQGFENQVCVEGIGYRVSGFENQVCVVRESPRANWGWCTPYTLNPKLEGVTSCELGLV